MYVIQAVNGVYQLTGLKIVLKFGTGTQIMFAVKVPCPEDKPRELCHGNNPHSDVMQGKGREKAQPGNREGHLQ